MPFTTTSAPDPSSQPATQADLAAVYAAGKKAGKKKVKSKYQQKQESKGGLFGTGVGPDYSLKDLISEPVSVAKDFAGLGVMAGNTLSDLAWAGRKKWGIGTKQDDAAADKYLDSAGDQAKQMGVGMATSMGGTAADLIDATTMQPIIAGVGNVTGLDLGKVYSPGKHIRAATESITGQNPGSFGERVEERGSVLSPLLEDVGNVAIVAGAASKGLSAVGAKGAAAKVDPFRTPLRESWNRTGRKVTQAAHRVAAGEAVTVPEWMREYAARKGLKEPRAVPESRAGVSDAARDTIAREWESSAGLESPEVAASRDAFINDVNDLYDYLTTEKGVRFTIGDVADNPYLDDAGMPIREKILADIEENNHLFVDKTGTFGETIDYLPAEVNDKFRAVHDYASHQTRHAGFDIGGEELATLMGEQLLSPEARPFHAAEVRGQTAMTARDGSFPAQKAAILSETADPNFTKPKGPTARAQHEIDIQARPTNPRLGRMVERLGPEHPIVQALARLEERSLSHSTRVVIRELERFQERERNAIRHHPAVEESVTVAREMIEAKGLNAYEANAIVGDQLEWRVAGKAGNFDDALAANPELAPFLEKAHARTITPPPGILDDPAIVAALDHAAETWVGLLDERLGMLEENRPGIRGLEDVDSQGVKMTKKQRRLLRQAETDMKRHARLKAKAAAERKRAQADLDRLQDQSAALTEKIRESIAKEEHWEREFDLSRKVVPAAFKNASKWQATVAQAVSDTVAHGGVTINPFHDRIVRPVAFGGKDTGWGVTVNMGTLESVPVAKWAVRGAEVLDSVAKNYQDVFANPDMSLGTWLDKETGLVHVDISQSTQGGTPLTRANAIMYGKARLQEAVLDFVTGDEIRMDDVPGRPETAAIFADKHHFRDFRANEVYAMADKLERFTPDAADTYMALSDETAVALWKAGKIKHPDDFYRRPRYRVMDDAKGLPENALKQDVLDLVYDDPEVLHRVIVESRDLEKRLGWYYESHDWVEQRFRTRKDGTPHDILLPSGVRRNAADLMYDLIAVTSQNVAPTANLGHALSVIDHMNAVPGLMPTLEKVLAQIEAGTVMTPQQVDQWATGIARMASRADGMHGLENVKGNVVDLLMETIEVDGTTRARGLMDWDAEFLNQRGRDVQLPESPFDDVQAMVDEYGSYYLGKLKSFRDNLADPDNSMMVTADSWMSRGEGQSSGIWSNRGEMGRVRAQITEATRMFNAMYPRHQIKPHAMQALFWAFAKQEVARLQRGRFIAATDAATLQIREGVWTASSDPTPELWRRHTRAVKRKKAPGEAISYEADVAVRDTLEGIGGETKVETNRFLPVGDDKTMTKLRGIEKKYLKMQRQVTKHMKAGDLLMAEKTYRQWVQKEWGRQQKAWAATEGAADFAALEGAPRKKGTKPRILDRKLKSMEDTLPEATGPKRRAYQGIEETVAAEITDADRARYRVPTAERAALVLNEQDTLFQTSLENLGQEFVERINGAFIPLTKEGHMEIRLFKNADPTTLFHEHAHMLRQILPEAEMALLERVYGVENGRWTKALEERVANDFIAYLNSDAPRIPQMAGVFKMTKDTLGRFWTSMGTRFVSENVPLEVTQMWDEWLTNDAVIEAAHIPGSDLMKDTFRPAPETGSMRQRLQKVPDSAKPDYRTGYRTGVKGARAAEEAAAAGRRTTELVARKAQADKAIASIKKMMAEDLFPSAQEAQRLGGRLDKRLDTLAAALEGAPGSHWPTEYQHIGIAIDNLKALIPEHPELAQYLEDVPMTFSEVLKRAREKGFEPRHIRDFNDAEVQRLVYDSVQLGNAGRLGKETVAGTRMRRYGVRAKTGQASRSIEALAASYLEVTHERYSNHLVDWVERNMARKISRGEEAPKGWVAWDPVKSVVLGEKVDLATRERSMVAQAGTHFIVPKSVATTMRRMTQDYSHGIFKGIGKVTSPWRTFVLSLSPRWYVNNFVGNLVLASLEGVKLRDWRKAWESYKIKYADTPAVTGHSYVSDIGEGTYIPNARGVKGFKEAASLGDTKVSKAGHVRRHGFHRLRRMNEAVDEFARSAVYHKTLRKTGSAEKALHRANDALIDYGNLSPFERQAVRAVVPFYSWQKGILKLVAKMPIDHPIVMGITVQLGELNRELMEDQWGGSVPSAYLSVMRTPFSETGAVSTRGMNPFIDSAALASPDGIAGSLNPFVAIGARQVMGAPELGWADDHRMDPYGFSIPNTNPARDLADLVKNLPVTTTGVGLGGRGRYDRGTSALKAVGVNWQSEEALARAQERARKYRVTVGEERSKYAKEQRRKKRGVIPLGGGSGGGRAGGFSTGG